MRKGKFTARERSYLLSLPAVETVREGRIFYSDEFKRECMRRYHEGDRPVVIFQDAGLYPELIGGKRIERCMARWREDERRRRLGPASAAKDRGSQSGGDGSGVFKSKEGVDYGRVMLLRYEGRLRTLERRLTEISSHVEQLEYELQEKEEQARMHDVSGE